MDKPGNLESQKKEWISMAGKEPKGKVQYMSSSQPRFSATSFSVNYAKDSPNIGWLFYRNYYSPKDVKWADNVKGNLKVRGVDGKNKRLFGQVLENQTSPSINSEDLLTLELKTSYPGLLTGSGISHAFGNVDEEIKLGFAFDYTSGLPYIPGSSVKGAIRAAFKKLTSENSQVEQTDAVDIFKKWLGREKDFELTFDQVKDIEKAIFDSGLNPYQRDVFFDAFPLHSQGHEGRFLDKDFITPHTEGPFKDPVPIMFMKVLPEVVFEFRFRLKPSSIDALTISPEDKLNLFKSILLSLGIGAKTNVGYGQFVENINHGKARGKRTSSFTEKITEQHKEALKHDPYNVEKNHYKALVSDESEHEYLFKIMDDCYLVKSKLSVISKLEKDSEKRKEKNKPYRYDPPEIGDEVTIRINQTTEIGKINFTVLPNWK